MITRIYSLEEICQLGAVLEKEWKANIWQKV